MQARSSCLGLPTLHQVRGVVCLLEHPRRIMGCGQLLGRRLPHGVAGPAGHAAQDVADVARVHAGEAHMLSWTDSLSCPAAITCMAAACSHAVNSLFSAACALVRLSTNVDGIARTVLTQVAASQLVISVASGSR